MSACSLSQSLTDQQRRRLADQLLLRLCELERLNCELWQDRNNNLCGCDKKGSDAEETGSSGAEKAESKKPMANQQRKQQKVKRLRRQPQRKQQRQPQKQQQQKQQQQKQQQQQQQRSMSQPTPDSDSSQQVHSNRRSQSQQQPTMTQQQAQMTEIENAETQEVGRKLLAESAVRRAMESGTLDCVCHKRRCRHCGFVCPCFEQICPSCNRPFRSFAGIRNAIRSTVPNLRQRLKRRGCRKRQLNVKSECSHTAMVRVGGGFVPLVEYLKSHNKVVLSNVRRNSGPAFLSPQLPHYAGPQKRGQPRGIRYVDSVVQQMEETVFTGRQPGRLKCEC